MSNFVWLGKNALDDDDVDRWFRIEPGHILYGVEFDVGGSLEMYDGDCILLNGKRCKATTDQVRDGGE